MREKVRKAQKHGLVIAVGFGAWCVYQMLRQQIGLEAAASFIVGGVLGHKGVVWDGAPAILDWAVNILGLGFLSWVIGMFALMFLAFFGDKAKAIVGEEN